jgi:hypothetical protein
MKYFSIELFDGIKYKSPIGFRSILAVDEEIFTTLEEQLHEIICRGLGFFIRHPENGIKINEKGHNNLLVNRVAQMEFRYKIHEAIESKSAWKLHDLGDSHWKSRGSSHITSEHLADIGLPQTATLTLDEEFDIQEQIYCDDEESMKALIKDYRAHFPWKKNPYKGYFEGDDTFNGPEEVE